MALGCPFTFIGKTIMSCLMEMKHSLIRGLKTSWVLDRILGHKKFECFELKLHLIRCTDLAVTLDVDVSF